MTQGARTRTLADFKDGYVNALVATDVAARGIHVDGIDLVLNVDPAGDHKDYLHRSGRTARAGQSGTVVSLALPHQRRQIFRLMEDAGVDASRHIVRRCGAFDAGGRRDHRRPFDDRGPGRVREQRRQAGRARGRRAHQGAGARAAPRRRAARGGRPAGRPAPRASAARTRRRPWPRRPTAAEAAEVAAAGRRPSCRAASAERPRRPAASAPRRAGQLRAPGPSGRRPWWPSVATAVASAATTAVVASAGDRRDDRRVGRAGDRRDDRPSVASTVTTVGDDDRGGRSFERRDDRRWRSPRPS